MGDYNSITSPMEHKGGPYRYYSNKGRLFLDFINENSLLYIGYVGSIFSWCNDQHGQDRRWAFLDCCLINPYWSSVFNLNILTHLPKIPSDYSPLFLSAGNNNHFTRNIFLFENYWLQYADCVKIVRNAFHFHAHSSPMHNFAYLLTRMGKSLLDWKAAGLGALDKGIRDTEVQLQTLDLDDMENPLSNSDLDDYRALQNKYNALLRRNSLRWAERARLMWVKDGDRNTNFFRNTAKIRNHVNRMSCIVDDLGHTHTE